MLQRLILLQQLITHTANKTDINNKKTEQETVSKDEQLTKIVNGNA